MFEKMTRKRKEVEMEKKTGRSRPLGKAKALRDIEGSSAVPRPAEVVSPSVDGDDSIRAEGSQRGLGDVCAGGCPEIADGEQEDPWLETMKDLARLVLAAYEADSHRFDEPR